MSLYQECSTALDELIANPPKEHGGVFTELDVVRKAATPKWSTEDVKDDDGNIVKRSDWTEAFKQANQVCGTAYRARKLARFGPVKFQNGEDYGRIAAKIAYTSADGPDEWVTPNGAFPKLMIENDSIRRQGRNHKASRNDLVSWDEQDVTRNVGNIEVEEVTETDPIELARRVKALETNLRAATDRATKAMREAERLRSHRAGRKSRNSDLLAAVEDLQKRMEAVEAVEAERKRIYADA